MELKQYWKVVKRRWWLMLIPALVVLGLGLATYQPPGTAYNVGVRFIVGQLPADAANLEDEERLANWQVSEYLVNGITDWVQGNRFAELVSAELQTQGVTIPAGAIRGNIVADNVRSQLQISVTFGDAEQLEAIINAVITVLQTQNGQILPQLGGETAVLTLIDDPIINPIPVGIRSQLDLPLRIAAALLAGIGLGVIVEYLDPAIREREEITALGLEILGEIPKK